MLELYHNETSVCAAKVRFALEEKELAWTGRHVDIFSGEQHRPEYRRLNPLGVVPTLVRDGISFIESNIINEYLDDAFPQVPLRPADAAEREQLLEEIRRCGRSDEATEAVGTRLEAMGVCQQADDLLRRLGGART